MSESAPKGNLPPITERLKAFVGVETMPPQEARDAVNEAMIRHWCDALGDANPVYTDPDFAKRSVHGGIVAPPTMLQAWTLRGLEPKRADAPRDKQRELFELFDEYGYTSVVATNCEQEYRRYLRPGDRIVTRTVIESISDEKKTALGDGYFYNTRTTFTDQNGEELGWMTFRVLKFKSALPAQTAADSGGGQAPAMPKPQRLRPAINEDNRYFWDGVKAGKLLIQKCADCGKLRHPGRPMCPSCRSLKWGTIASSGRGTVHSFVVMHYPHAPTFEYPFAVAVVDLEEKPIRFVASICECDPHAVEIGMPVELVFNKVDDELVIPEFRPAGK